jgi:hypothetical protein
LPTEIFLARADGTQWVHRNVRRELAGMTCQRDGIPFLAPEVVLLFKTRSAAGKDQHDVATVLPLLDAGQRSWLQDTLKHLQPGQQAAVPRG